MSVPTYQLDLLFDKDNYTKGRLRFIELPATNQTYTMPPDQCGELLSAYVNHQATQREGIVVYLATPPVPPEEIMFTGTADDTVSNNLAFTDLLGMKTLEGHGGFMPVYLPSNASITFTKSGGVAYVICTVWQWTRKSSQAPTEAQAQTLTALQELTEGLHRLIGW